MDIWPKKRCDTVLGKRKISSTVSISFNRAGYFCPIVMDVIAAKALMFTSHQKLFACCRSKYPSGRNNPIAIGNQTALLPSTKIWML